MSPYHLLFYVLMRNQALIIHVGTPLLCETSESSTREPRGKKSNFEVTQYKSKDEVDKAYEMEEHQQAIYQEQLPVKQRALILRQ